MKSFSFLKTAAFILIALIVTGCPKNKSHKTNLDATVEMQRVYPVEDTSFYFIEELPDTLDLNQDISKLSLQTLRLLHHFVYARHGKLFMEADLRGYFSAQTSWYDKLINAKWDTALDYNYNYNSDANYDDVVRYAFPEIVLSLEETAFLEKVDARMQKLLKENYLQKDDCKVGNIKNIVNLFQFEDLRNGFMQHLAEDNMVITPSKNIQLFHVYDENDYCQIPNFITTDLMLQAFHIYFSYTLRNLEQNSFIPILQQLTLSLYEESMKQMKITVGEMQEIAAYNAVFYAIPYYLLTDKKVEMPTKYKSIFEQELKQIAAQTETTSALLRFDMNFPYDQFKPRGHYSRNAEMERYFKAMQWLQLAPYCRENSRQLQDAIFAASLLNSAKATDGTPLLSLYQAIYQTTEFLIGEADNLSIMDIATFLKKTKINTAAVSLQADNVIKIDNMLRDLGKTRNRIGSVYEHKSLFCRDRINFMPARYVMDNEVLNRMLDATPNATRAFPKGLDIFAAFGSQPAYDVLLNTCQEPQQWAQFIPEIRKLQSQFNSFKQWNNSVYNKWIESLLALQKSQKSYPEFMQLPSWNLKNLNSSLASWTELKHDAILYAEQPVVAECGGGEQPPSPTTIGYVEPNILFWNKLEELVNLTSNLLTKNKLMTPVLQENTDKLKEYVLFLKRVSQKELRKEKLTPQEYETIEKFGASIEYFTLEVMKMVEESIEEWDAIQGPDKSVAVVADVFTRNILNCDKCGILHEGVGLVNYLYVVVEIEGLLYLTRGATFSYHEFVQPLNQRLTDEEWQQLLDKGEAPPVPTWMDKIIFRSVPPKANERIFYSSGC
jgi:hypothetical protein